MRFTMTCGTATPTGKNRYISRLTRIAAHSRFRNVDSGKSRLDAAFIERQRQYLIRLRASLQGAERSTESEEADITNESAGNPREYEEEAQKVAALALDEDLIARDIERIGRVDRALKKIDEGTYGLSDLSGQRIPQERLEAIPEAIYTRDEEQAREDRR